MPYVVKHKEEDRFFNGSNSIAAFNDINSIGLVTLNYAQTYATLSGAKSALASWARKLDNNAGGLNPSGHHWGAVVRDQTKYDMMEIVEVKVTL
jgi:hypothetical protein